MTTPHKKAATTMVAALKEFQDAVDFFDAKAAASLGVNATDLRAMTALRDQGVLAPSEVATRLGLTRGATTTALDRLEARGYAARRDSEDDGRGVLIDLTPEGRSRVDQTWNPMRRRGAELLRSYTVRELEFLMSFFQRSVELQKRCADALSVKATYRNAVAPLEGKKKRTKRR